MARPRTFDRDQAVHDAMDVFWECGYEGASTALLEERLGIGRSSLYAAFVSKDALFAEAMARYVEDLRERVIEPLRAEGPALDVLQAFFDRVVRRGAAGEDAIRCCMIVRACATGGNATPEIASLIATALGELDDAFYDLLRRARDEGALRLHTAGLLRGLARLLTTTFQGLNIAANAGRSRRELRDVIRPVLGMLA